MRKRGCFRKQRGERGMRETLSTGERQNRSKRREDKEREQNRKEERIKISVARKGMGEEQR